MKQLQHNCTLLITMIVIAFFGITAVLVVTASTTSTSSIVTRNKIIAHHPSSMTNVLRGIQKFYAEQQNVPIDDSIIDSNMLQNCCYVTSRSVSQQQQSSILSEMLSFDESENDNEMILREKIIASSNGLIVTQPSTIFHAIQTMRQQSYFGNSNILYYPHPTDIQRNGEGLLSTLGPIVEECITLLTTTNKSPSMLYVLVTNDMDPTIVQEQLERSLNQIIPYCCSIQSSSSTSSIRTIHDVFPKIMYVSPQSLLTTLMEERRQQENTVSDDKESSTTIPNIISQMASGSSSSRPIAPLLSLSSKATAQTIAAYNTFHPVAQEQYENVIASIERMCSSNNDSIDDDENDVKTTKSNNKKKNIKLVPEFGKLCDAIIKAEVDQYWYGSTKDSNTILRQSKMGQQIQTKLREDLFLYISTNTLVDQMITLQKTYYDLFKKELSKLVISPNLQHDMNKIGQASIASFITSTVQMIPYTSFATSKSHTSYLTSYVASVQRMYIRKVQDYIYNRILLARSTNKYRPIPRKGITIGFHYLLPKPFGNDYRQEPSMIHATDNMVYIPKESKLSDVPSNQILSSSSNNNEWMNSLVPHPPGNDMIYMQ